MNGQPTRSQTDESHESPVQNSGGGTERFRNPSIRLSLVTLQTSRGFIVMYTSNLIFYADSFWSHLVGGLLINSTRRLKIT